MTIKKAMHFLTATFIGSLFVFGCDTTEKDWQEAREVNTIEAYQSYREAHPASVYDSLAFAKIEGLSWEKVVDDGEFEAYQQFIGDFPQSEHVAEATRISDELLWGRALEAGTVDAYEDYLSNFPNGVHLKEVRVDVNASWFPRLDSNQTKEVNIPANAKYVSYIQGFHMSAQERSTKSGTFIPDPSLGKISMSGTLETTAGPISKTAEFGAFQYIYSDSSRTNIIGWASCLVSGEVILPLNSLAGGPRGKFVSNSFDAEELDENWLLLNIKPEKQHNLCIEQGNFGNALITQGFPGTVVTTGRGVFTRFQDGWHFAMPRLDS